MKKDRYGIRQGLFILFIVACIGALIVILFAK